MLMRGFKYSRIFMPCIVFNCEYVYFMVLNSRTVLSQGR